MEVSRTFALRVYADQLSVASRNRQNERKIRMGVWPIWISKRCLLSERTGFSRIIGKPAEKN